MLESTIEDRTCTALAVMRPGTRCPKWGDEGWPDRLILLGSSQHFWIEFKQEGRPLRPDQRERCEDLVACGDTVLVIDTVTDGMLLALEIRDAVSPQVAAANARRFAQAHAPTLRALQLPARRRSPSSH